jgi:hypothetical protein
MPDVVGMFSIIIMMMMMIIIIIYYYYNNTWTRPPRKDFTIFLLNSYIISTTCFVTCTNSRSWSGVPVTNCISTSWG